MLSFSPGDIRRTIAIPKEISFIPPNAMIETRTLVFNTPVFWNLSDTIYNQSETYSSVNGAVSVKSAKFNDTSSLMVFRSYLTLFSKIEQKVDVFAFDFELYVSKSIQPKTNPKNLASYRQMTADGFYNSEKTGYGKVIKGVGLIGAFTGATALLPEAHKINEK